MAQKQKKKGFLGKYGPRYGRKIREKTENIEKEQKKAYKCPFCHKAKVKRFMTGIWYCSNCGAKIAGKAYMLGQKPMLKAKEDKFSTVLVTEEKIQGEK